jgi:hypothetical protein
MRLPTTTMPSQASVAVFDKLGIHRGAERARVMLVETYLLRIRQIVAGTQYASGRRLCPDDASTRIQTANICHNARLVVELFLIRTDRSRCKP